MTPEAVEERVRCLQIANVCRRSFEFVLNEELQHGSRPDMELAATAAIKACAVIERAILDGNPEPIQALQSVPKWAEL